MASHETHFLTRDSTSYRDREEKRRDERGSKEEDEKERSKREREQT